MSEPEWETIKAPRGAFIGWGNKRGQFVQGTVVTYDEQGGRDYDSNPCPQLNVELSEKAASFDKAGDRTDHAPGELVTLTCGQISLRNHIMATQPKRGDLIKITLDELQKSQNGTAKLFDIKIARGKGKPIAAQPAPAVEDWEESSTQDDEPPF